MSDAEILPLLQAYGAAVLSKDANALMQMYGSEARVFDAWGVWIYDGAHAWRPAVEHWFSSLGSERVRVDFEDVVVKADHGLAVVSAIASYTGLSADDVELRAMQNRLTWVLRSESGAWRVIHEHTSAPIDFDHSTAILRRGIEAGSGNSEGVSNP